MIMDVRIGDRVQTIKGCGIVTALVDDFVVVDLDGDHGTYMFDKKGIWKIDL